MQMVIDRQMKRPENMRRIPEWLPQIECIGVFHSLKPVRDSARDGSMLTIVWYQNLFGIEGAATESLRAIDWDSIALDYDY